MSLTQFDVVSAFCFLCPMTNVGFSAVVNLFNAVCIDPHRDKDIQYHIVIIHAHIHTLTGSLIEAEPCLHVCLIICAFMISECEVSDDLHLNYYSRQCVRVSVERLGMIEVPGRNEDNRGCVLKHCHEHRIEDLSICIVIWGKPLYFS